MVMQSIAALVLCLAFGQEKPGSIEGRVVNARTGEPVRKVTLTLIASSQARRGAPPQSFTSTTDSGGLFWFPEVAAGAYAMYAEKAGFLRQPYGTRPASPFVHTPIKVAAEQRVTGIEFKLLPQGVITGRVIDEDGDPLPHVSITVIKAGSSGSVRHLQPANSANSNDIGEYRIPNLAPGKYLLQASSQARRGRSRPAPGTKDEQDFAPTYYPSATSPAAAIPILIEPGADISGMQIQLRRSPIFHVRGSISALPAGTIGRSVRVMLVQADRGIGNFYGWGDSSAQVREDLEFEIRGVLPGNYVAVAMRTEGRPLTLGRIPVTVSGADIEGVTIPVGQPVSVTGSIGIEDAGPDAAQGLRVHLYPIEGMPMGPTEAGLKPDGTFRIDNVSREKFYFAISPSQQTLYVKSVQFAGQESIETGIDLSSSGATAELQVVLGGNPGSIEGSVKESEKTPGERHISLIPEGPRQSVSLFHKTAVANADGTFSFKGIAPGRYLMFAWDEPIANALTDPEFFRKHENNAVKVTVNAPGSERAEPPLIRLR